MAYPSPTGDGKVTAWDECPNGHCWMNESRSMYRQLQYKLSQKKPLSEPEKKQYMRLYVQYK